jgi:predicted nucleic acid-binding protein
MIFVDTSFWIALAARKDGHHEQAVALLAERSGAALVTSNHVRGEAWTFLRRRYGHGVALGFRESTERSDRLRVAFVSTEQERDAWAWLGRHDERPYSFVDATSFALMRSLRITEALAFDGDFAAAGFVELRV